MVRRNQTALVVAILIGACGFARPESPQDLPLPVAPDAEIAKAVDLTRFGYQRKVKGHQFKISVSSDVPGMIWLIGSDIVTGVDGRLPVKFKVKKAGVAIISLTDQTAGKDAVTFQVYKIRAGDKVDIADAGLSKSPPAGTSPNITYEVKARNNAGGAMANEVITLELPDLNTVKFQNTDQRTIQVTTDAQGNASVILAPVSTGTVNITATANNQNILSDAAKLGVIDVSIAAAPTRALKSRTTPKSGTQHLFRAQHAPTGLQGGTYAWTHEAGGTFTPAQGKDASLNAPAAATPVAQKGNQKAKITFTYLGAVAEKTTPVDIIEPVSLKKNVIVGTFVAGPPAKYERLRDIISGDDPHEYWIKTRYFVYDQFGDLMTGLQLAGPLSASNKLDLGFNQFPQNADQLGVDKDVQSDQGDFYGRYRRLLTNDEFAQMNDWEDDEVHLRVKSDEIFIAIDDTAVDNKVVGAGAPNPANSAVMRKAKIEAIVTPPDK